MDLGGEGFEKIWHFASEKFWNHKTVQNPKFKWGYTLVTAEIMCILNITYVNQNIIPSEYQTSEEVKLWHSLNASVFWHWADYPPAQKVRSGS